MKSQPGSVISQTVVRAKNSSAHSSKEMTSLKFYRFYPDKRANVEPSLRNVSGPVSDLRGTRKKPEKREERKTSFQEKALPHLDALYRHTATLSLSDYEIEDLLEETFLTVSENSDGDYSDDELKSRLFSTLWDIYKKHYVHSGESSETAEPDPEFYEKTLEEVPLGLEKDRRKTFFANISSAEITQAMKSLPEQYLSCLDLVDVEDFSYDEVAEILSRPRQTVKSQLHRGRNIIKQKLLENAIAKGIFPSG